MPKLISRTISLLRFPMIVGIVMIHTDNLSFVKFIGEGKYTDSGLPVFEYITNLIGAGFATVCVPLFFFISGFLFFFRVEWDRQAYINKMKKRIYTLLLPYVLWNYIAIAIFALFQWKMPELQSGNHIPIVDWTYLDFLVNGLWRYQNEGVPFVAPLWFLRDLILVIIITPIIYKAIDRFNYWPVLIYGFFWFLEIGRYWWFGSTISIFFFSWGAYYSIKNVDFIHLFKSYSWLLWIGVTAFIIDAATKQHAWNSWLHSIGILCGLVGVILIASRGVEKGWKSNVTLLSSTFFVFAAHEPYWDQVRKIFFMIVPISRTYIVAEFEMILIYVVMGIVCTVVLVLIYCCLNKLCPCVASILSGGR